jgi:nitrite reductase/ring-hydroxylating ferredoxin subunit
MTSRVAAWHAVVRAHEAAAGEIVPVRLLGRDVAVWRTGCGAVKAWDDRCPHRGTRLTLGTNDGTQLICRYHGWRFDAGTAQCTHVPAHPTQTPPRKACVASYRCVERYGLVWVSLGDGGEAPDIAALNGDHPSFTVRSVTFDAAVDEVERALAERDAATAPNRGIMTATLSLAERDVPVVYALHPQSPERTTLHGVLRSDATGAERVRLLRAHHDRMKALRRHLYADVVGVG